MLPSSPESSGELPAAETTPAPQSARQARRIAEFAGREDFPACMLGEFIDIGGFTGVVVGIVKQSVKIRSADGVTQSFNSHRLRALHAPVVHAPEPPPMPEEPAVRRDRIMVKVTSTRPPVTETDESEPGPVRQFIADPDYTQPVVPIGDFAGQSTFPQVSYGRHVEINGYAGVVVEIVKQSIKVRSAAGLTRSFNAPVLRKLHGRMAGHS